MSLEVGRVNITELIHILEQTFTHRLPFLSPNQQRQSTERWNRVRNTDPSPDPTQDASDPD